MNRFRLGVRARLTVGATLFAAVVLLAAFVIAHQMIASALLARDRALATEAIGPYAVDILHTPAEHPDGPSAGTLIAVRSPDGRFVVDTLPADVLRATTGSRADAVRTATAEYVVERRTVEADGGTWTIWSARSAAGRTDALMVVDATFVATGAGLLVVLCLGFWFFARAALRPVERMRIGASELGDDDLLPVGQADDELSRLAATLNELVARTRESAARERRMVSNAAHELRTPIANLRAGIEIAVQRSGVDGRETRDLRSLERMVGRLSELAANLLELSRLDEGHPQGEASVADLVEVALAAVDAARLRTQDETIDIDHEIGVVEPGARVRVDAISFGRLLDNLLANAIAAVTGSDVGSGSVRVTLEDRDGTLVTRVQDSGPGMSPDLLATAFDRFTRGTTSSAGSGLGLSLVRAIATAAGGTASLEQRPDGFAVVIRLPNM